MEHSLGRGGGSRRVHGWGLGWSLAGAAVVALLGLFLLAGGARAQAAEEPLLRFADEGVPPPGANVACTPTEEHPYPVVLVHGTFETMAQNWDVLSPELKARGYCVFALNYGGETDLDPVQNGLGPIEESAKDLDGFVDEVLDVTGAEKVQVIGHSQGGMMPRQWIKFLGGAPLVEDLIGFAPSNYGTELGNTEFQDGQDGDGDGNAACPACDQQGAGSQFLKNLNAGDDTPGPGSFTQIATENDEIIIPFTRCFLKGKQRTQDVTLQKYKPYSDVVVTHQNIYQDPYAKALAFDALDNPGPAKPKRAQKSLTP